MLKIAPGVRVGGFAPELVLALGVAESIYGEYGHDCVLTSGTDGGGASVSQ